MLITGGYHSIRTGAIFTSLTVGLRGTDRRFIFAFVRRRRKESTCSSAALKGILSPHILTAAYYLTCAIRIGHDVVHALG